MVEHGITITEIELMFADHFFETGDKLDAHRFKVTGLLHVIDYELAHLFGCLHGLSSDTDVAQVDQRVFDVYHPALAECSRILVAATKKDYSKRDIKEA